MVMTWAEKLLINNAFRRWLWWERKEFPIVTEMIGDIADGSRCLELGTGMGMGAVSLAAHYPGLHIVATDFDLKQLRRAERHVSRQGFSDRIELKHADAAALPFGDGEFGYVFAFGMLHHVPDYRTALREAARVLIPGGKILVMDCTKELFSRWGWLFPPDVTFSMDEMRQALLEGGFTVNADRAIKDAFFFIVGTRG